MSQLLHRTKRDYGTHLAVSFSPQSDDALNKAVQDGKNIGIHLIRASSLKDMVASFDTEKNGPRVFVMSLPHGPAVDQVLNELLPLLSPEDVVIDGNYPT